MQALFSGKVYGLLFDGLKGRLCGQLFNKNMVVCSIVLVILGNAAGLAIADGAALDPLLALDLRVFVAGKPINLILVEKDKQRLRLLRHDGRLKVMAEYRVATGENEGPKEVEGDAKTPEGVYFVTKIYTDSKVSVFGKRAFHLDYPNIFDQRAGKGGNGIFVHGTNKKLQSNSTNGCITLNNDDLEKLVDYLPVGTVPVVVVSSLANLAKDEGDEAVNSFVGEGFALAKQLMIEDEFDPARTFFDNLYMIQTNNQKVAVGEYRTYIKPGEVKGGFVRSYLDYSEGNGWVVSQIQKDSLDLEKGPSLVAKAAGTQETLDYSFSLLDEKEESYLNWYREFSIKTPMPAEPPKTPEPQVIEVEKIVEVVRESEENPKRFMYLFLLSVAVSVGSVWFLTTNRERQDSKDNTEDGDERREAIEAVARVNKEIDWVKKSLSQIDEKIARKDRREGEFLAVANKLADLENELAAKEKILAAFKDENSNLSRREEAAYAQGEAQAEGLKKTIASLEESLKVEADRLSELENKNAKLLAIEKERDRQTEELNSLQVEKARLLKVVDQQEGQEKLIETLQLAQVELTEKLTEAEKERMRHTAELAELKSLEEELAVRQAENDSLRQLTGEQESRLQEGALLQEKLALLENSQAELREKLSEAEKERMRHTAELAQLKVLEEELSARQAENDSLRQLTGEQESRLQEGVVLQEKFALLETSQAELRQKLNEAEKERSRQAEELAKLRLIEEELAIQKTENDKLRSTNGKLEKLNGQVAESKSEIVRLSSQLELVERQLQEADTDRQRLDEQAESLRASETTLKAYKQKVDRLSLENLNLREIAEHEDRREKELAELKKRLTEMENELRQAVDSRRNRERELGERRLAEEKVERQAAVVETIKEQRVTEKPILVPQEGVVLPAAKTKPSPNRSRESIVPGQSYILPDDVLAKWIGK